MSAIGDYVHLTAKGYERYGISKNGNKIGFNKNNVAMNFKKSLIKTKDLEEIKKIINQIRNPESIKDGNSAKAKQAQKIALQILQQKYGEAIQGIDFDYNVVEGNFIKGLDVAKRVRHKDKEGRLVLDRGKTINALDRLENNMKEEILKEDSLNIDVNMLKEEVRIYKDYARIIQNDYKEKGFPTPEILSDMNILRKNINEIIDCFNSTPPIDVYNGQLWQIITGLVGYVAGGTAIEELEKKVFKGSKNVEISINNNFIKNPKIQQEINSLARIRANGTISRRSKVDIQLLYNNTDFKISNKSINIKDHTWITVVSDSPLLVMIMGMDANFVNHYLNYYSYHLDNKKINDEEGIYKIMKANLFYQGLTGDNFSNNNIDIANVLAINDKLTGNINLIPMGEIVQKIDEKINNISVLFNDEPLNYYYFKNQFVPKEEGGFEQRIINLVQELHSVKVKAAFNISNFGI